MCTKPVQAGEESQSPYQAVLAATDSVLLRLRAQIWAQRFGFYDDFSPKLQETQWIESWLSLFYFLRVQDLLGSFPCKALPLSIINTKLPLSSDSFQNVEVI